jgi:hypothetical protein
MSAPDPLVSHFDFVPTIPRKAPRKHTKQLTPTAGRDESAIGIPEKSIFGTMLANHTKRSELKNSETSCLFRSKGWYAICFEAICFEIGDDACGGGMGHWL